MGTKCRRVHKEKTSWRAVTSPLDSDPIWPYISHMNKTQQHLSIPENRINYSFHFLDNFSYEFVDYKKCYDAIAKWSDNLDTSESHFWCTNKTAPECHFRKTIYNSFRTNQQKRWAVDNYAAWLTGETKLTKQTSLTSPTSNETFLSCFVCYPRC